VALAVKAPLGETLSQVLFAQLCSELCTVAEVEVWAVTVSVCGLGAVPPPTALKVNEDELKLRAPPDVTSRVML